MNMRQIMQISVALMMLVPSAVSANNMITDGYTAGDSVKLEKNTVADADTRVITGTVYDVR